MHDVVHHEPISISDGRNEFQRRGMAQRGHGLINRPRFYLRPSNLSILGKVSGGKWKQRAIHQGKNYDRIDTFNRSLKV